MPKTIQWSEALVEILRSSSVLPVDSSHVLVLSDYCGDDGTVWWTAAFVLLDWDAPDALIKVANFVTKHGGSPSQYKKLRSARELANAKAWLDVVNGIRGHVVAVASRSKLKNLSFGVGAPAKLRARGVLHADWNNDKLFERAGRICHILARVLEVGTAPHCEIDWLGDRDQIADTPLRRGDLHSIVNSMRCHYQGASAANVDVSTRDQFTGEASAQWLCTIPDLVAGAFNELLKSNPNFSQLAERGTSLQRSVEISRHGPRFDTVHSWLFSQSSLMTKTLLVIDEDAVGLRWQKVS